MLSRSAERSMLCEDDLRKNLDGITRTINRVIENSLALAHAAAADSSRSSLVDVTSKSECISSCNVSDQLTATEIRQQHVGMTSESYHNGVASYTVVDNMSWYRGWALVDFLAAVRRLLYTVHRAICTVQLS